MGRILAVDLGSRRIGLAITDPLKMIASPFKTLAYRSDRQLLAELVGIVNNNAVELVIVGLPLREDGSENEVCQRSRNFADRLRGRGIQTIVWDERYTSREAEESLRKMGLDRKRALDSIDRIAASYILEDYLAQMRKS